MKTSVTFNIIRQVDFYPVLDVPPAKIILNRGLWSFSRILPHPLPYRPPAVSGPGLQEFIEGLKKNIFLEKLSFPRLPAIIMIVDSSMVTVQGTYTGNGAALGYIKLRQMLKSDLPGVSY